VVIEIILFWFAPGLIARFGAARLLSACLAVTALRWTVTALFAASLPLMLLAQTTHALGFAMFHACCMQLMTEHFPGRRQSAGQGLLYGFSSGVGGVLGAAMAALLWEQGGGRWAFLGGAVTVLLAMLMRALRAPLSTKSVPVASA
jgi:PPP family 3-phenylpropionic acid transporter